MSFTFLQYSFEAKNSALPVSFNSLRVQQGLALSEVVFLFLFSQQKATGDLCLLLSKDNLYVQ